MVDPMRLFVASIAYDVDDSALFTLFADMGFTVRAAKIAHHEDGRSKGFGFVDIPDPHEAESAISQLNDYHFRGRYLKVEAARDKWDKS